MELKQLCSETLNVFGIDDILQLKDAVLKCVIENDTKTYDKFVSVVEDLSIDWLQMIFQYYYADRKEKMQDYTPVTLAKAVAKISRIDGEKVCFDMCSGSGALTIQKWNVDKNISFICEEFDEKVIPFLLFNLAIRNITATVIHGDVLSGDFFKAWSVTRGTDYGAVSETQTPLEIKADTCISNPPYNMPWQHPVFAQMQSRFKGMLPPESNANYAFIQTAIDCVKKAVLIMPTNILTTDNKAEKEIRKYIVNKNLVENVVINPDNMFEKTSIGTCLITLSTEKKSLNTVMGDMRNEYTEVKREQNGQYGGAAHEGRTYTKTLKTYTDEQIDKLCIVVDKQESVIDFSSVVNNKTISENDYNLMPARYIEKKQEEYKHRPFQDIVSDINAIVRERNSCRLVVNETVAREMHLTETFCLDAQGKIKNQMEEMNSIIEKICGMKIENDSYIRLTKNKNEFSFVNTDKERLSPVLVAIMRLWEQAIQLQNERENFYLCELRDALLPELMSGKIDVNTEN